MKDNQLRPFHLAIPVSNLDEAREFYGNLLGLAEGRSSSHWIDYNFFALADSELKLALEESLDELMPKVIEWRHDSHQHPELANREFRTSKKVADHLISLGLEVETGIAYTGVVALIEGGSPGPTVAVRADMDALPVTEKTGLPFASTVRTTYLGNDVGVMHACGHDAHVSILMGVAEFLVTNKDKLKGNVLLIFQPAEEGPPEDEGGGAKMMLEEGIFERYNPEAIFGLHVTNMPNGYIAIKPGPALAAASAYRITIKGYRVSQNQATTCCQGGYGTRIHC